MKTINLNKPFLQLDGSHDEKTNLGQILSNALSISQKGDALKFHEWSKIFFKGEAIDLDPSDYKLLYDFVNNHEGMFVIFKAQVLNILNDTKDNE